MTSGENLPHAQLSQTALDDVRATHADWWNALVAADEAALDTLLPDDWFYYGPSGGSTTKAELLERLRSGLLKYDAITDPSPLIRLHGQTAIVTGPVYLDIHSDGQPMHGGLNYTAVYGWIAPQWRLLAYQSTVRAEPHG